MIFNEKAELLAKLEELKSYFKLLTDAVARGEYMLAQECNDKSGWYAYWNRCEKTRRQFARRISTLEFKYYLHYGEFPGDC